MRRTILFLVVVCLFASTANAATVIASGNYGNPMIWDTMIVPTAPGGWASSGAFTVDITDTQSIGYWSLGEPTGGNPGATTVNISSGGDFAVHNFIQRSWWGSYTPCTLNMTGTGRIDVAHQFGFDVFNLRDESVTTGGLLGLNNNFTATHVATINLYGSELTVAPDAVYANNPGSSINWTMDASGLTTIVATGDEYPTPVLHNGAYIGDLTIDYTAYGTPALGETFDLVQTKWIDLAYAGIDTSLASICAEWSLAVVSDGASGHILQATYVPEPATVCLLALGGLSLIRRKRS